MRNGLAKPNLPMCELKIILEQQAIDPGDRAARLERVRASVHRAVLGTTPNLTAEDYQTLVLAYDREFFAASFSELLRNGVVDVRVSTRIASPGQTAVLRHRGEQGCKYRLLVNPMFVAGAFGQGLSAPTVAGLVCSDELDLACRILEHELVHLAEFHVWNNSSCHRKRFQGIAFRLFGHLGKGHQLVDVRRRRIADRGLEVDGTVIFRDKKTLRRGLVVSIGPRIIVEVTDAPGEARSFSVPLECVLAYESNSGARWLLHRALTKVLGWFRP
jgi:hypothetical protein